MADYVADPNIDYAGWLNQQQRARGAANGYTPDANANDLDKLNAPGGIMNPFGYKGGSSGDDGKAKFSPVPPPSTQTTTAPPPPPPAPPPPDPKPTPPPSMTSLSGGGDTGGAAPPPAPTPTPASAAPAMASLMQTMPPPNDVSQTGPSGMRQGLGMRVPPQYNYALASLQRGIY